MEDTLRGKEVTVEGFFKPVLILVLMEDTLRELQVTSAKTQTLS